METRYLDPWSIVNNNRFILDGKQWPLPINNLSEALTGCGFGLPQGERNQPDCAGIKLSLLENQERSKPNALVQENIILDYIEIDNFGRVYWKCCGCLSLGHFERYSSCPIIRNTSPLDRDWILSLLKRVASTRLGKNSQKIDDLKKEYVRLQQQLGGLTLLLETVLQFPIT